MIQPEDVEYDLFIYEEETRFVDTTVYSKDILLVSTMDGLLTGVNPETGQIIWQEDFTGSPLLVSALDSSPINLGPAPIKLSPPYGAVFEVCPDSLKPKPVNRDELCSNYKLPDNFFDDESYNKTFAVGIRSGRVYEDPRETDQVVVFVRRRTKSIRMRHPSGNDKWKFKVTQHELFIVKGDDRFEDAQTESSTETESSILPDIRHNCYLFDAHSCYLLWDKMGGTCLYAANKNLDGLSSIWELELSGRIVCVWLYRDGKLGKMGVMEADNLSSALSSSNANDLHSWFLLTQRGFKPRVVAKPIPSTSESPDQAATNEATLRVYLCIPYNFQSTYSTDFIQEKCLGYGAFGIVFQVKKKVDNGSYAVKRVRFRNSDDIKVDREVDALSELNHEGVLRYYHAWIEKPPAGWQEHRDSKEGLTTSMSEDMMEVESSQSKSNDKRPVAYLYIQMQLCPNGNLREWLWANPTRDPGEIWLIFKQIASALSYIHSRGKIHRDIKPENVFFDEDKVVKIGDFGLCTKFLNNVVPSDPGQERIGHTNDVGTKAYQAPEQRMTTTYDEKVDVFALGLILLELLFPVSTEMERYELQKHARENNFPDALLCSSPNEIKLLQWLLNSEPKFRPTAQEVCEFLGSPSKDIPVPSSSNSEQ